MIQERELSTRKDADDRLAEAERMAFRVRERAKAVIDKANDRSKEKEKEKEKAKSRDG